MAGVSCPWRKAGADGIVLSSFFLSPSPSCRARGHVLDHNSGAGTARWIRVRMYQGRYRRQSTLPVCHARCGGVGQEGSKHFVHNRLGSTRSSGLHEQLRTRPAAASAMSTRNWDLDRMPGHVLGVVLSLPPPISAEKMVDGFDWRGIDAASGQSTRPGDRPAVRMEAVPWLRTADSIHPLSCCDSRVHLVSREKAQAVPRAPGSSVCCERARPAPRSGGSMDLFSTAPRPILNTQIHVHFGFCPFASETPWRPDQAIRSDVSGSRRSYAMAARGTKMQL
ncbi:uncharacterized protein J3D65DRAFT_660984 [Phyllosticta citribraziliensis]|uniref:Uncharacterized protein n=1 Tax=Phyllosticta citribraziliensis TaxID=989973 RepID=A0ABR1LCV0_9PEZI